MSCSGPASQGGVLGLSMITFTVEVRCADNLPAVQKSCISSCLYYQMQLDILILLLLYCGV